MNILITFHVAVVVFVSIDWNDKKEISSSSELIIGCFMFDFGPDPKRWIQLII